MWTSVQTFSFLSLISFSVFGVWFPSIPSDRDAPLSTDLFRLFNEENLQEILKDCVRDRLKVEYPAYTEIVESFQWTAVTTFRHISVSNQPEAWIIVAGNAPRISGRDPKSVYTKQAGAVVGCNFKINQMTLDIIGLNSCTTLSLEVLPNSANQSFGGLLGTGLNSIELPSNRGNLLVFCDPLWHSDYGTNSPGGKCSIRHRRNGTWQKSKSDDLVEVINFCSSGGRTEPCAGGFSVDLRLSHTVDDDVTNVQLLAGIPLSNPNGRSMILNDLLRVFKTEHSLSNIISDIKGEKELFGSSVAFVDSQNYVVVSAPSISKGSPSIYSYRITNYDEALAYLKTSPHDILGKPYEAASEFGGFGFSIETVSLQSATSSASLFAVVTGAPYETVPLLGKNTGRVYVFCVTSTSPLFHNLAGSRQGEMFGYSLSRVDDVDGDGIDDVAIGSPALENESGISGRVYIHRLLPDCRLDTNPIQVINAPNDIPKSNSSPNGFGIAISRGVDLASDGSPEIAVTTMDPHSPVFLYSMSRRLRASCQILLDLPLTTKTINVGSKFEVTFLIRLTDGKSNRLYNIPAGMASTKQRTHQIDPDILWQNDFTPDYPSQKNNTGDFDSIVDEFLASSFGTSQLERSQPRFYLEGNSVRSVTVNDPTVLTVKAILRARAPGEFMNLARVPLQIAYRSILSDPECKSFNSQNPTCSNSENPVVDWSKCKLELSLSPHICPPFPQCSADLLFSTAWIDKAPHSVSLNGTITVENIAIVQIPYGHNQEANRQIELVLFNTGPTKSTGVRIELRSLGWSKNASYVGIRTRILGIRLSNLKTNNLLGGYGLRVNGRPLTSNNQKWSISIAENEGAAIITTKSGIWLYPDEKILLEVSLLLDGLNTDYSRSSFESTDVLPSPGLRAEIFSSVQDSEKSNNVATLLYHIVYTPSIQISVGSAPPALIDNRKKAYDLKGSGSSHRVPDSMLGPRLDHSYLVENTGHVELRNITLRLEVPLYTDDGDLLIYISKQLRRLSGSLKAGEWISTLPKIVAADGREAGSCRIDPKFIDPYELTILETSTESQRVVERVRRQIPPEAPKERETVSATLPPLYEDDSVVKVYFKRMEQQQNTISCSSSAEDESSVSSPTDLKVVCVSIDCNLDSLPPADTVRIYFSGWLYAQTYFKLHLPDVRFISRLSLLKWGDLPPALNAYAFNSSLDPGFRPTIVLDLPKTNPMHEMAQSIVFRGASSKRLHRMLVWPILAGVFGGITILTTLIYLLCYCGFFRRRKHTNEAKRRASYRRSLMTGHTENTGGGGGALSLLLPDKEKSNALIRNGDKSSSNMSDQNNGNYNAHPMVKSSPDLVYAVSPQPPSPYPDDDEEDDASTGHLVHTERQNQQNFAEFAGPEYCSSSHNDEAPLIHQDEDASAVELLGVPDIAVSNSETLPDWLLGELDENATSKNVFEKRRQ